MKRLCLYAAFFVFQLILASDMLCSAEFIRADNPAIQYFGRWDLSDPANPKHSWPGTYICTEFSGTNLGIRMDDNSSYYNIYIDGSLKAVFHGDKQGTADYAVVQGLENRLHTLRISKRNFCFDRVLSFSGLLLDSGASVSPPKDVPARKIEFIGDSFTAAEGNEADREDLPWNETFPVTNIDLGFAPVIARHYGAQYHTTCRSGSGLVCDWRGNFDITIPKFFDRTLMEVPEPKWDFSRWQPDVVVVALGLNDHSGLKDKEGNVSEEKSEIFRNGYHDFLKTIRRVYPGVQIVAVAAYTDWIRENVIKVCYDEKKAGRTDIHYSQFDRFDGGYVAHGHPTVETHRKMADQIIRTIDSCNLFSGGHHLSDGK